MAEALRLFVVEDDEDTALLIRKTLERAGHHVTRCRTAAAALIVLGQDTFDLVLLDHFLPDMEGLDLLQALSREGITTPALMVTGEGDEQLATRALHAGALDYIAKKDGLLWLTELPKRVAEAVTRHRLQNMNRLLIEAQESARDGIMITDLQGTILHVNQALERMTGYDRNELVGQNPRLLKSGRHPPELYADLWRTILARTSWQGELTNRRKDGTLVDVSLTVSPIVNAHGQLTHFVGIHRDITEHRLLQRQLLQAQKMQSVGTLAGGVAHEFNNLLAGISGYASLGLREPGLPVTVEEFLRHIVDLAERAAVLTRQMLAFARKPTLVRNPTRMEDMVKATAELAARTLHLEVGVEVQPQSPPAGPLLVAADSNQLQQALINLVLNARDASPKGAPICFHLSRQVLTAEKPAFPENVPPGDYVVVAVCDQGSGMTPEVLSQALDPFFTTKEVGQGTGLGLSVVYGIVHGHQGFLTIDTEPGQGTEVAIYLPRMADPARPKGQKLTPHVDQEVEPEATQRRHILVVDDEEVVRDVVRRFLEIAGHQVTCVGSGAEAQAVLRNGEAVDLVILDLMMPKEDGTATFFQLRQLNPNLPVLLCTGLLEADPAPQVLQATPVSLLRKPFRMNELWYAVNQSLSFATAQAPSTT